MVATGLLMISDEEEEEDGFINLSLFELDTQNSRNKIVIIIKLLLVPVGVFSILTRRLRFRYTHKCLRKDQIH